MGTEKWHHYGRRQGPSETPNLDGLYDKIGGIVCGAIKIYNI